MAEVKQSASSLTETFCSSSGAVSNLPQGTKRRSTLQSGPSIDNSDNLTVGYREVALSKALSIGGSQ